MRPRTKDKHLPPCVYLRHGRYWYVKRSVWHDLGRSYPEAMAEFGRLTAKPTGGMGALIQDALETIYPRVAVSTRKGYADAAKTLREALAEFSPEQVKPRHIAELKQGLSATPNYANRCISVLRQVFDYALDRQMVDSNPCVGIKRLHEKKRERLISAAEFDAIYAHSGPRLQVILDLLYLTGQRVTDVLRLRRSDLTEDGIAFRQAKTGTRLVVAWTSELRTVVARAHEIHGKISALTLLPARAGKAPDYRTVHDQFVLACAAAGVPPTQLRDLRAMSLTAARKQGQDATALAGHKSASMTDRYLRDREVPIVQGPTQRRSKP